MSTWPVLLSAWQIECCGAEIGVGKAVDWWLLWTPEPSHAVDGSLCAGTFKAESRAATQDLVGGSVLEAGGLTAWWEETVLEPGEHRLTGVLREEHHERVVPGVAATSGVVRAVFVVSQLMRPLPELAGRAWGPAEEPARLRQVQRAPRRFDDEGDGASGERVCETGLLVQLDVSP